jgi:sigma-B regulation protein RsbU (phosphoserine phosphatase)
MPSLSPLPVRPARLVLIDPGGNQQDIAITASPFRIGRQPGIELTLHDSRISRLQAQIIAADGGYILEDTGSRHGTFVNGQKVLRHELRPKDAIDFGITNTYRMLYVGDSATLNELLEKVTSQTPPDTGSPELHHLGFLLEVARAFGSGLKLDDVLTIVVDASLELTHTQRGMLLLTNASGKLVPAIARGAKRTALSINQVQVSSGVLERVIATRRELIVSEVEEDTGMRKQESIARLGLHTLMAIPIDKVPPVEASDMTVAAPQSELLGILYLDSKLPTSSFSDLDREVLRTLAREATVVVENARLFSAARDKARLDHEIEIASDIQRRLQPRQLPQREKIEFGAFMLACHSVGGDFFDVVELGSGRFGFIVGDIAGKGISASILASMLQGVIGSLTSVNTPMNEILSRVNRYVHERTPEDRYATLFYGILDGSGRLEYTNAGHVPALIRRESGKLDALPSANFPIGLFPDAQFDSEISQICPGDFLMLYTDGVSEATNVLGEMFEEERVRMLLRDFQGETAEELAEVVRLEVQKFTLGAPQSDDITALVVHYLGLPS